MILQTSTRGLLAVGKELVTLRECWKPKRLDQGLPARQVESSALVFAVSKNLWWLWFSRFVGWYFQEGLYVVGGSFAVVGGYFIYIICCIRFVVGLNHLQQISNCKHKKKYPTDQPQWLTLLALVGGCHPIEATDGELYDMSFFGPYISYILCTKRWCCPPWKKTDWQDPFIGMIKLQNYSKCFKQMHGPWLPRANDHYYYWLIMLADG